jgi:hypothetical protein
MVKASGVRQQIQLCHEELEEAQRALQFNVELALCHAATGRGTPPIPSHFEGESRIRQPTRQNTFQSQFSCTTLVDEPLSHPIHMPRPPPGYVDRPHSHITDESEATPSHSSSAYRVFSKPSYELDNIGTLGIREVQACVDSAKLERPGYATSHSSPSLVSLPHNSEKHVGSLPPYTRRWQDEPKEVSF